MNKIGLTHALTATASLWLAGLASAQNQDQILAIAFGSDMAGASVSVEFSRLVAEGFLPQPVQHADILATGQQDAAATIPGLFSLTMNGNTYFDVWRIENLSADLYITRVLIDLSGSASVFDDGSESSTLDSNVGRPGPEPVLELTTSGLPLNGQKQSLWNSPINTGDLYTTQTIQWLAGDFGPGQAFVFMDDTDVILPAIPAPGPLATLAMAGLIAMRRRR